MENKKIRNDGKMERKKDGAKEILQICKKKMKKEE